MDLQIKGKTAIITGGTKGIGAGIAKVFAAEGVNLALAYRSDEEGAAQFVSALMEDFGIKAIAIKADISNPAQVEHFYKEALLYYPTVDILVNNAAGGSPDGIPFEDITWEQWQSCLDGCLSLVFTMSGCFVRECKRAGHSGHIVNISAKAAFQSKSHHKIPYATAKGAVATMTQRMANDLISNEIFVNAIVPGYVLSNYYHDSDSFRCKEKEKDLRIGWAIPEDIGNVAAFLCSPCSKQIIGAVVDCSGGTML